MIDLTFSLSNKTAVITGGASGIGKSIAQAYLEKGANIVLLDLREDVEEIARGLHSKKAIGIKTDITSTQEIKEAINKILEKFSTIDLLVNSAGVALLAKVEDTTEEIWNKTIEINLTASFKVAQEIGKVMINKKTPGTIINIASQAATIAIDEHVAYCASKAGILGLTKVLALEWSKYNINVNSISPTIVMTELGKKAWAGEKGEKAKSEIPLNRFALPEEVAALAVFLASDAASMITGENILIDGGNTIK